MKITILTITSNIFLKLFCSSVQEQRRQEAGVSRSEELPQSMKIRERVTRTATRSDTKLYKARERADGLKLVTTMVEMEGATMLPIILVVPDTRLALEGLAWNWNSTNLAM